MHGLSRLIQGLVRRQHQLHGLFDLYRLRNRVLAKRRLNVDSELVRTGRDFGRVKLRVHRAERIGLPGIQGNGLRVRLAVFHLRQSKRHGRGHGFARKMVAHKDTQRSRPAPQPGTLSKHPRFQRRHVKIFAVKGYRRIVPPKRKNALRVLRLCRGGKQSGKHRRYTEHGQQRMVSSLRTQHSANFLLNR